LTSRGALTSRCALTSRVALPSLSSSCPTSASASFLTRFPINFSHFTAKGKGYTGSQELSRNDGPDVMMDDFNGQW